MLFSKRLGDGQPLLVLHGFLGDHSNWLSIGKQLSSHFDVHLLDLPNHGNSPHTLPHTYTVLAKQIQEYCTSVDISDTYIIGHSMGGKVAMQLAHDFPALIKKMIIVDIAPKAYAHEHEDILSALWRVHNAHPQQRQVADTLLQETIPDINIRAWLLKSFKPTNTSSWKFNLEGLTTHYQDITSTPHLITIIDIPTLFLYGELSNYVQLGDKVMIKTLFSQATMQGVPQAGHWLHAQTPNVLIENARTFFTS